MQKKPKRRCSQCSWPVVPDPRLGKRQHTCGSPECQRKRHASSCSSWRQRNRDATRNHYEDYVLPFRDRRPDYQRCWRVARKMREIRDAMLSLADGLVALAAPAVDGWRDWAGPAQPEVIQGVEMTEEMVHGAASVVAELRSLLRQVARVAEQLPMPTAGARQA